jgi:hypothetical protein
MNKPKDSISDKPKKERVPFKLQIGWSSRALSMSVNAILIMQVTYFCTNILGMSPILVGTTLLLTKLFDGTTDFFQGMLINKVRTRFGQVRHYEICLIPMWICTVLLFSCPMRFSDFGKATWIFIFSVLTNDIFGGMLYASDAVYLARSIPGRERRAKLLSINGVIIIIFSVVASTILPKLMATTSMAKRARDEVGKLPLYYTEWGSLAGLPSDGAFGASFIAKTVLDNVGIVDGYSFWTFSDIFEEQGQNPAAFHGGFGLLTQAGIPKAPYNAFRLLRQLGGKLYPTQSQGTVDIYPVYKEETNVLQLLAVNHNSLLHDIADEALVIKFPDSMAARYADIRRVDDNHANPLTVWESMGKPEYLTKAQTAELISASEPVRETLELDGNTVTLTLPAQGTALVSLYL